MKRIPHTWVVLFALVAAAAAATWVIPAGVYQRTRDTDGRETVDPATYQRLAPRPATVADVFLALPRGLEQTSAIVFYIFLIGGAFGVIGTTGAVEAAIGGVVRASGGRGEVAVPALALLFSLGGATIGMAEETLPFLPALVVLARRLGYDEVTGGAIALVGAGAGFAGAFLNPFTVGVAQGIAGLPLFSGLGYRLIVYVVVTAIAIAYLMRYARRVRREPAAPADPLPVTLRRGALGALVVLALALAAVIAGALSWGWGLLEMAGLFVAAAVAAGLTGGLGPSRIAEAFVEGAAGLTGGALVVGLARGVLVIFDGARVTDTILHAMAGWVEGLPAGASLAGIYAVQVALSYLVPSGSGQAAVSLPILAPLGDLVGVSRQTSVLAYQLGDGFSNILTPTQGYFMAGLALIGVPWTRWARFILPLQLMWLAAGLALLLIAHAIDWGPF